MLSNLLLAPECRNLKIIARCPRQYPGNCVFEQNAFSIDEWKFVVLFDSMLRSKRSCTVSSRDETDEKLKQNSIQDESILFPR